MSGLPYWRLYFSIEKERAHRRWFETGRTGDGRIDAEGKNLSRAKRDTGYLQGARFVRCDLSESDLCSGNLKDAEIIQCIWDDALLRGTHFDRSLIQDCRVVAAYLGIADFIETRIQGGDWSKSDFDTSTWTNATVENACFHRADFRAARLSGARFINCDFREANLLVATPRDAIFEGCDFRGAYLEELALNNTVFERCCFYGCVGIPKLEGDCSIIEADLSADFDGSIGVEGEQLLAFWGSAPDNPPEKIATAITLVPEWRAEIGHEPQFAQADWVKEGGAGTPPIGLEGKNLSPAFLYQAYLICAHLTKCDLTSGDLRRAELHQAKFVECIFDRALLMNALAKETVFQDCRVYRASVNRLELEKGQIIGGDWSESVFNNCIWHLSRVENVRFGGSSWNESDVRGTHFLNCDFRGAQLTDANLFGCVFEGCDFRQCELSWAKIGDTKFERCGFHGIIGTVLNWDFELKYESLVIEPDLSENFDGTGTAEATTEAKKFFDNLRQASPEMA